MLRRLACALALPAAAAAASAQDVAPAGPWPPEVATFVGWARPRAEFGRDDRGPSRTEFDLEGVGDEPPIPLWASPTTTIRHESDPSGRAPLDVPAILGRRVRVVREEWYRPEYRKRLTITLLGGVHPRDFDFGLVMERWVRSAAVPGRRRRLTPDEALVLRGLASPHLATREAATRLLVARGMGALAALAAGLDAADAEVKERCRWCLVAIRDGE
jgi:hypothetical protein